MNGGGSSIIKRNVDAEFWHVNGVQSSGHRRVGVYASSKGADGTWGSYRAFLLRLAMFVW